MSSQAPDPRRASARASLDARGRSGATSLPALTPGKKKHVSSPGNTDGRSVHESGRVFSSADHGGFGRTDPGGLSQFVLRELAEPARLDPSMDVCLSEWAPGAVRLRLRDDERLEARAP